MARRISSNEVLQTLVSKEVRNPEVSKTLGGFSLSLPIMYLKPGSQYDAGRCVASRHASLKRCRNATRRWNRTKFYSCVANVAFLLPAKGG